MLFDSLTLFWRDSDGSIDSKVFDYPNVPEQMAQLNAPDDRIYWLSYKAGGVTNKATGGAKIVPFTSQDLGFWGAMSIFDLKNNGCPSILGAISDCRGGLTRLSEADLGLANLRQSGRVYRDIRFADFDNDGYLDIFLPTYTGFSASEQNYLLKNNHDRSFSEIADSAGVADRNRSLDFRPEECRLLIGTAMV